MSRSVVAISDDREWLAVLDPHPVERSDHRVLWWTVYHWEDVQLEEMGCEEDTGQDATVVLREWMEDADESV